MTFFVVWDSGQSGGTSHQPWWGRSCATEEEVTRVKAELPHLRRAIVAVTPPDMTGPASRNPQGGAGWKGNAREALCGLIGLLPEDIRDDDIQVRDWVDRIKEALEHLP